MPDDNNLPIPNQTAGPVKPVLTTEEIPAAPTAQTPTASTPSTDLNPTATIPTAGFSIPETTDVPPPPPAAAGLPPIIPEAPRKKFGGKKFISTILGLLLLVGGVGVGVTLVQRQQDIREKAAGASCGSAGGTCYTADSARYEAQKPGCKNRTDLTCPQSGYACVVCGGDSAVTCTKSGSCGGPGGATECATDERCKYTAGLSGGSRPICVKDSSCGGPTPTSTPPGGGGTTPGGGACTQKPEIWGDYSKFPIDKADCEYSADNSFENNPPTGTETFRTCYEKYKAAGCQTAPANPQDDIACAKITRRLATKYGYPSYECGAKAKELAVINCTNAMGVYEKWCLAAAGPIAQCRDIKAYDTNWTALSAADLSSLKAGDKVRFAVSGTAASGTITKARFIINGTTRPEVTQKKPGTEEFYDEYTIPEGTTSFSVNAQLFHSTEGWF